MYLIKAKCLKYAIFLVLNFIKFIKFLHDCKKNKSNKNYEFANNFINDNMKIKYCLKLIIQYLN